MFALDVLIFIVVYSLRQSDVRKLLSTLTCRHSALGESTEMEKTGGGGGGGEWRGRSIASFRKVPKVDKSQFENRRLDLPTADDVTLAMTTVCLEH